MGKAAPDATLDAFLTKIATATRQTACSAEPANFAGIAAVALADAVMTPGDGNDYAIATGDTSGRKITTTAKADENVTTTDTATHVALDDGTDLIFVTTCDSQPLTTGNTVTFPAWSIEIGDPT